MKQRKRVFRNGRELTPESPRMQECVARMADRVASEDFEISKHLSAAERACEAGLCAARKFFVTHRAIPAAIIALADAMGSRVRDPEWHEASKKLESYALPYFRKLTL